MIRKTSRKCLDSFSITDFLIPIPSCNILLAILMFYGNICIAQPSLIMRNSSLAQASRELSNDLNIKISKVTVINDRVTARVSVVDERNLPLLDLVSENFIVKVGDQKIDIKENDLKNPSETNPTKAFIVVLLDMSGSMKRLNAQGVTRIKGALSALKSFSEELTRINNGVSLDQRTQVAIVPFGEPGKFCSGFPVNSKTLDRFLPAGDFKLNNYIEYLSNLDPCASTDIYTPVQKTIDFLSEKVQNNPDYKYGIILLSDGYHNKPNEEEDFSRLLNKLKNNPNITLHTLGYGLTPEQLGELYGLNRPATRADIKPKGKVPEEEFVDKERLLELARVSGGISEFSADAEVVSKKLILFITSLLGEYEISYNQPNSERGQKYEVSIGLKNENDKELAISKPFPYTVTLFGRSVDREIRVGIIMVNITIFVLAGILPYYFWSIHLKNMNT